MTEARYVLEKEMTTPGGEITGYSVSISFGQGNGQAEPIRVRGEDMSKLFHKALKKVKDVRGIVYDPEDDFTTRAATSGKGHILRVKAADGEIATFLGMFRDYNEVEERTARQ